MAHDLKATMRIGFDVAQTCAQRAGCAWYADSLLRAMVEVAPENQYLVYHQFGNWINGETAKGTSIKHPSVRMPFWGMKPDTARQMLRVLPQGTLVEIADAGHLIHWEQPKRLVAALRAFLVTV